ncbi:MAG: HAMP domain-containing sensor histidine kinase [Polyangiaceae bacterium]
MTVALVVAAVVDVVLLLVVGERLRRARREGYSLRLVLFGALSVAALAGAFVTGVYVVSEEAARAGLVPLGDLLARIAPKAFLVGSVLLALAAAVAAEVGRRLARSIEELTEAASRIAGGEPVLRLPGGWSREGRQLARALAALRRELEGRPYAAAFLRDAWHDLKTPAAALKATIEILEDEAIDDPVAARKFVANLRRSSEQLERTLDDLVTLARFETAALAPDRATPVIEILVEAFDAVQPLAEARGVRFALHPSFEESESLGSLRCDPSALVRALTNLIENAILAVPAAGGPIESEVTVSAWLDPRAILISISNSPAEIPTAMRAKLFERAATSRKGSGSGLGLAIARAAIEAHGGRITFTEFGPPQVSVRVELPR